MNRVYLSRRNLLTLLSKLDRKLQGEDTACAIVKLDTVHPIYPCSSPTTVIALEDDEYYDRDAGVVHPNDDPNNKK